jgi:opacity protein-like surface antigen
MIGLRKALAGLALATAALAGTSFAASADGHRYNWSGLYFGANAGWLTGEGDWTYPNGTSPQPITFDSGVLGGHIGLQHQFNSIVVGVEGGWMGTGAFADNDFDGGNCPNAAFRCLGRLNSLYMIGPRVGWTPSSNWMLYLTGGYASGRIETRTVSVATGLAFDQSASRHDGWYLGGGVEVALAHNMILGVEYLHIDLDARNAAPSPFSATEVRNNLSGDADVVRARLSFILGRPAPATPLK